MQKFFWRVGILLLAFGLAACGSGDKSGDVTPSATLPPPQVRVQVLPTTTVTPAPPSATVENTSTATVAVVQAWPTVDDEQFLFDQIDNLIGEIDRRLNSTNTNP